MSAFAGQRVAIVGAGSGIGLATARAAAGRGAETILLGRTAARLQAAARSLPGAAETMAMDMLDADAVAGAFAAVGALDHLVLTAVGDEYALFGPVVELTDVQVERSFDKLRGFITIARAAAPRLRPGGSITMLSGAGAARPPRATALAAAANGAIVSFGKALAVELAPLRVNVVMPGVVDTPLHGDRQADLRRWAEGLPTGRIGQPEDIADAILFLAANPYMTGHVLVIDGGYLVS